MEPNIYAVDLEARSYSCTSERSDYPVSKAGPIRLSTTTGSNKLPRLIKLEMVEFFLRVNDTCKLGCRHLNDLNIFYQKHQNILLWSLPYPNGCVHLKLLSSGLIVLNENMFIWSKRKRTHRMGISFQLQHIPINLPTSEILGHKVICFYSNITFFRT